MVILLIVDKKNKELKKVKKAIPRNKVKSSISLFVLLFLLQAKDLDLKIDTN